MYQCVEIFCTGNKNVVRNLAKCVDLPFNAAVYVPIGVLLCCTLVRACDPKAMNYNPVIVLCCYIKDVLFSSSQLSTELTVVTCVLIHEYINHVTWKIVYSNFKIWPGLLVKLYFFHTGIECVAVYRADFSDCKSQISTPVCGLHGGESTWYAQIFDHSLPID